MAEGWGGTDSRSQWEIERDNAEFARRCRIEDELRYLRERADKEDREKKTKRKKKNGEKK